MGSNTFNHSGQLNSSLLFATPSWSFTVNSSNTEKSVFMYTTADSRYFTSNDWETLYVIDPNSLVFLNNANNGVNVSSNIPNTEIVIVSSDDDEFGEGGGSGDEFGEGGGYNI